MASTLPGSGSRPEQTLALNMKLLAHHDLQGFGGMGEGVGMQITRDGRRILWLAHESAPKNFTGVDVTDPRHPKVGQKRPPFGIQQDVGRLDVPVDHAPFVGIVQRLGHLSY